MAETNISTATTSDFTSAVVSYSVSKVSPDSPQDQEETTYQWSNFTKWFGYYKKIPELKKAIDAYATWVVGKGYDADPETQIVLENIRGWGEDTFNSILFNLIVTKKICGDAIAEIVKDRESGELINLKPLSMETIKIVVDRKGLIKRYEQISKVRGAQPLTFKPNEILHLCNDRIVDEIHGTSVVEACEQVILMRNEALSDYKTVLHRNIHPLKIWHLDTDDQAKINAFKSLVETTVKDKENIFVPKGNVEVELPTSNIQDPLAWIKYLENFFYQAVGIPKIILGGSEEFTEASSKIAYLTFEQIYAREQEELQNDLWNQLALSIEFIKPASLRSEMLSSEEKNTGQVGFQPKEMMPTLEEG